MLRFLLFLLLAASACPQAFDATRVGSPLVIPNTALWRFQQEPSNQNGTQLGWAATNFDDSTWTQGDGGTPALSAIRWYRLKLQLPPRIPGQPPLALLIYGLGGAYEVFADGQQIDSKGSISSRTTMTTYVPTISSLPPGRQTVQLALRVWMGTPHAGGGGVLIPGLPSSELTIGERPQLEAIFHATSQDPHGLGQLGKCILASGMALLLFLVWLHSPQLKSNLWLAWSLVGHALYYSMASMLGAGQMSENLSAILQRPVTYFILITEIEFLFAYFNLRVHRLARCLQGFFIVLALLSPILPVEQGNALHRFGQPTSLFLTATLWAVMIFYRGATGNPEARILILPAAFRFLARILFFLTFSVIPPGAFYVFSLKLDPIVLDPDDVATYLYLLSIGTVLIRRFLVTERISVRTAGELEAAREAQLQLVPVAPPSPPGFRLEASYLPASEVGGDFYQVLPLAEGKWLIVLGDVSGKGLKAAMSGATLIGVLRSLAGEDESPSSILARLNRMLCQNPSGGFTTCLCLSLSPDGSVVLANAGHLAPYLAGNEVPLPNGLPLGLDPDATFEQLDLVLRPGQSLTILSDGVIEAENPQRELFGFDRTRSLSTQSAESIAQAARAWGQTDDITVVTVQKL